MNTTTNQDKYDELMNNYTTAQEALDDIHACMDGKEWDADTLDQIAGILNQAGYEIRTAEEMDP